MSAGEMLGKAIVAMVVGFILWCCGVNYEHEVMTQSQVGRALGRGAQQDELLRQKDETICKLLTYKERLQKLADLEANAKKLETPKRRS